MSTVTGFIAKSPFYPVKEYNTLMDYLGPPEMTSFLKEACLSKIKFRKDYKTQEQT